MKYLQAERGQFLGFPNVPLISIYSVRSLANGSHSVGETNSTCDVLQITGPPKSVKKIILLLLLFLMQFLDTGAGRGQ